MQGIYTSDQGRLSLLIPQAFINPGTGWENTWCRYPPAACRKLIWFLYITDITRPYGGGEEFIINYLQRSPVPVFLVVNKMDLNGEERLPEFIIPFTAQMSFAEIVPVSAADRHQSVSAIGENPDLSA